MISLMKAKLDASRSLLYETCRFVDIYKAYDIVSEKRPLTKEEKDDQKIYNRLADAFTPLLKMTSSEYANQNTYDCIQVHGGSGFMKDYACERLYRDARITTIYEGTSQLQVVAAIRHVTTGSYLNQIRVYLNEKVSPEFSTLRSRLSKMADVYEKAVAKVVETKDNEYIDFQARRMVEMAGHIVMGCLLILDSTRDSQFARSAELYVNFGEAEVNKLAAFINGFDKENIDLYKLA
jgi:hypothetical protein